MVVSEREMVEKFRRGGWTPPIVDCVYHLSAPKGRACSWLILEEEARDIDAGLVQVERFLEETWWQPGRVERVWIVVGEGGFSVHRGYSCCERGRSMRQGCRLCRNGRPVRIKGVEVYVRVL